MNIAYRFAYLKESLVLFNSLLVLSKVIKENASWIVRAPFISRLPGPLACKREYIVVLESLLCSYTVIRISIRHIEPWVVLQHTGRELSPSKYNGYIVFRFLLIGESLLRYDIFLALGRIEIYGQFDPLRLVDSQGQVRLFLQVSQAEALQVLLRQRLRIQDACGGRLGVGLLARHVASGGSDRWLVGNAKRV